MTLIKVENAIEVCKSLLDKVAFLEIDTKEVESYLTQYLTILISSEMEEKIEDMVRKRASLSSDPELENFVSETVDQTFRNPSIGEIKGLLKRFDESLKKKFHAEVIHFDNAMERYENIINDRHSIAHGRESKMTFLELIESYKDANLILEAFEKALFKK